MTALVLATPREVIAHHSKSFSLASKLLPEAARDDAARLYAWCRRVDDIVDVETPDRERLHAQLHAPDLHDLMERRRIPAVYPRELVAGMEMDLDGHEYRTLEDLIVYSYRVAGVVGLMMTHVLGIADDDALVPAVHLGIAMQITNICRDVAEDAERGRVYIPTGMSVRELLAIADRYYRSADRGLIALPARCAFGVAAARDIYSAIGSRIAAQDYDVNAGRAVVSKPRKIAGVALAALRTIGSLPRRAVRRGKFHIPTRTLELSDVPRL